MKNKHAVALGRKGGQVKSEKKANASRENGMKNKGKKLTKVENTSVSDIWG